jgi:hypothetical protein
LRAHRRGLDAVAAALLEHETLAGEEVGRLVDAAAGRRVGGPRQGPRVAQDQGDGGRAVRASDLGTAEPDQGPTNGDATRRRRAPRSPELG